MGDGTRVNLAKRTREFRLHAGPRLRAKIECQWQRACSRIRKIKCLIPSREQAPVTALVGCAARTIKPAGFEWCARCAYKRGA